MIVSTENLPIQWNFSSPLIGTHPIPGSQAIPLTFRFITGWWFGCHLDYFPINIGFLILPIDFHIFQRGWNHQPDSIACSLFLFDITRTWHQLLHFLLPSKFGAIFEPFWFALDFQMFCVPGEYMIFPKNYGSHPRSSEIHFLTSNHPLVLCFQKTTSLTIYGDVWHFHILSISIYFYLFLSISIYFYLFLSTIYFSMVKSHYFLKNPATPVPESHDSIVSSCK